VGINRGSKGRPLCAVSAPCDRTRRQERGWDDAYAQAVQTLKNLQLALQISRRQHEGCGAHAYLCDHIAEWEKIGRRMGVFRAIRPATSMVQVSALISPEMMVEIEQTPISGQGEE